MRLGATENSLTGITRRRPGCPIVCPVRPVSAGPSVAPPGADEAHAPGRPDRDPLRPSPTASRLRLLPRLRARAGSLLGLRGMEPGNRDRGASARQRLLVAAGGGGRVRGSGPRGGALGGVGPGGLLGLRGASGGHELRRQGAERLAGGGRPAGPVGGRAGVVPRGLGGGLQLRRRGSRWAAGDDADGILPVRALDVGGGAGGARGSGGGGAGRHGTCPRTPRPRPAI